MAATQTSYRVCSLPQELGEAGEDKAFIRLGSTLDVGAFGVGTALPAHGRRDRHPRPSRGRAGRRPARGALRRRAGRGQRSPSTARTSTLPQGTAIFVRDPAAMRKRRRDHGRHDRPRGRRSPRRGLPGHAVHSLRRGSGTRTTRRTTPPRSASTTRALEIVSRQRPSALQRRLHGGPARQRRHRSDGARRLGREVGAVQGAGPEGRRLRVAPRRLAFPRARGLTDASVGAAGAAAGCVLRALRPRPPGTSGRSRTRRRRSGSRS